MIRQDECPLASDSFSNNYQPITNNTWLSVSGSIREITLCTLADYRKVL